MSASLTGLDMAHAESLQVIQGGRVSLIDKNVKSYREYRVTMHAETMQRERFLHHLSAKILHIHPALHRIVASVSLRLSVLVVITLWVFN